MFLQPIDYFLAAWFVLVAASILYAGGQTTKTGANPPPGVLKLVVCP